MLLGEVADADRAHQPARTQVDQSLPGFDLLTDAGVGPVDQAQVDVLELEPPEGILYGLHRQRLFVVPPRNLGGHLDVFQGQPGPAQRRTDVYFVLVVDGAVDQSVADLQSALHRADALLAVQPGRAEAHDRKGVAVVERVMSSCLLYTSPSPRDG